MRFLSFGFVLAAACNCPKYQQPEPQTYTVSYVQCETGDGGEDASDAADASDASAPACVESCESACGQHPTQIGPSGPIECTGTTPGDAGDTIAQCKQYPGPVDPPACL